MEAKCFGEFMGTLVLVLLGDGALANVSLKHSKAEGAPAGWHHQWMGFCGDGWRLCRGGLPYSGRSYQSRGNTGTRHLDCKRCVKRR
jgi:hypothetical protein